jgi:hypothetical protein
LGLQALARFYKRLDNQDAIGRRALLDQAANDGAGHIAAANECKGLRGVGGYGHAGIVCETKKNRKNSLTRPKKLWHNLRLR